MNNNLKLTIVLLYILLAIIISIYLSNKPIISFFNNNFKNYDLVISRYNEDINWVKNEPFNQFNIICYNKGTDFSENYNSCKIIKLDNVGCESHTYLYHIINNYDNIAPITVFIPGSTVGVSYKHDIIIQNLKLLNETNTSVFFGCHINDVVKDLYDFRTTDYYDKQVQPSSIHPFGKFVEEIFGKDIPICKIICYQGIFIVAKEHIIQHPKEKYEKIIKFLDSHPYPEVGFYMERLWGLLFLPFPDSCIHHRHSGLAPGC